MRVLAWRIFLTLFLVCIWGNAVSAKGDYVIPPGQESHIQALISPYLSDGPVGKGRLRGISIDKGSIKFDLRGEGKARAFLILTHKSRAKEGDRSLPSFTGRLERVEKLPLAEKEGALIFEALARNDKGDFSWRLVATENAPPPDRAGFGVEVSDIGGSGGLWSWLKGTGFPMLLWLALILWGLFLAVEKKGKVWRELRGETYLWLTMGIVIAGAVIRVAWAPEALYKEAHPFRGLEAAFIPLTQPVAVSSSLPGYPSLLQLFHGFTGVHPVELLFLTNLCLGCALPLLGASIGKRIHKQVYAPLLYAGALAFLPHAIKYSHSEVFTGPMAFLILLSLRGWLDITRSWAYALTACLASALLAWIRPEAVLLLPGLALLGVAAAKDTGEPFLALLKRIRKPFFGCVLATSLLVLPALPRIWAMQASGQGIVADDLRTLGQTIDSSKVEGFEGMGLMDLFSKSLSVDHNVFMDPGFTPVLWMTLALLGLVWFLRHRFLWALGLLLCVFPLMLIYGLLVSSVESLGEMRYQLSLIPFFTIFAGAGAMWLVGLAKAFGPPKAVAEGRELMPRLITVAFLLCLMPYRGLVAEAEHPVQQEYRVLRHYVLEQEQGWQQGAFVAFPRQSKFIAQDIRPTDMSPILVPRKFEMHAITWKEIPSYMDRGLPVFLYRGLYAHYLQQLSPRGKDWFAQTWQAHLRSKGLELDVVYEANPDFVPHHSILDKKMQRERFRVVFYRVQKSEGSAL